MLDYVEANLDNIPVNLANSQNDCNNTLMAALLEDVNESIEPSRESSDLSLLVKHSNQLDTYRTAANESKLVLDYTSSNVLEEIISVVPDEGKRPICFLQDTFCKEYTHSHLFPTGKFGYKVNR